MEMSSSAHSLWQDVDPLLLVLLEVQEDDSHHLVVEVIVEDHTEGLLLVVLLAEISVEEVEALREEEVR